MRFVDDEDLSFCMTMSNGIDRDELLSILGRVEELPAPQTFDDFPEETYKIGQKGLLNVFEDDDLLITLENTGYMGATRRVINKIADLTGKKIGHYVGLYRSEGNSGAYHYVEVQDGMILANFDPLFDEIPAVVDNFFPEGGRTRANMIKTLEYRMETTVKPEWLELPTTTYVIDYRQKTY